MRKATKDDLRKVAIELLGPAMEPVQAEIKRLGSVVFALQMELTELQKGMRVLEGKKELQRQFGIYDAKLQRISEMILQSLKSLDERLLTEKNKREEGNKEIGNVLSMLRGENQKHRQDYLHLSRELSALSQRQAELIEKQTVQQSFYQKVLTRMNELEQVSVKNHSKAIENLSERMAQLVVKIASQQDDGE